MRLEWELHPHDKGRGGASLGACYPWGWLPPLLLYILVLSNLLKVALSHALWLASSSLVWLIHLMSGCLGEALLKSSLHHHHHAVVLMQFPRIHYFRCPTGARDGGRRQALCLIDHGGAVRLWH